jgi:hypothetical protein
VRLDRSLTSNFTENGNEESRYFREDVHLHINFQHRFWHKAHPENKIENSTPVYDRKGELFYYFHQNIWQGFLAVGRLIRNKLLYSFGVRFKMA